MQSKGMCIACFAVCALMGASPASAGVFDNPLNAGNGFGWNSNINSTSQQAADDVILTQNAIIDMITFYGFDHTGLLGNNFRVRMFTHNAASGEPESVAFYDELVGFLNGVDTGQNNPSGNDILRYDVDIPDVALTGGVSYWLMVASTDATTWAWSHSDTAGAPDDQFHRSGDGDSWRSLRDLGLPDERMDQAFTLIPVPAPGALALFGVAGLVARRRRR